jgi:hypothetical protein
MALQIRRGPTADRLSYTPVVGELVWDTSTNSLYIGNGSSAGGLPAGTLIPEDVQDIASTMLLSGTHSGITFTYNDLGSANGTLSAVVNLANYQGTIGATSFKGSIVADDSTLLVDGTSGRIVGPVFSNVVGNVTGNLTGNVVGNLTGNIVGNTTGYHTGDVTGSVFADNSTLLVDGVMGRLVGPLATTGMVADLDTDIFRIFSNTGTVTIAPSTRTSFGSSTLGIDGNVVIVRNTYSATSGFTFQQHHATADANNFLFLRTRGTGLVQTTVLNGDDLADIAFNGHDGTNTVAGAAISVTVEGAVSTGVMPTKFSFATNNGSSAAVRAELSSTGVWKVNTIQALSGTLTVTGNLVGNVDGDLQGSVFADNSTRIIDGTAGGNITAATASLSRSFTLPVYADATARDATLTAPSAGMMIFNTALIKFQGYTGSAWVDLN